MPAAAIRISFERPDGTLISPEGAMLASADGLQEKLDVVLPVLQAIRAGVELFPGQRAIESVLARLLDEPLYVVLVGKFMCMSTLPASGKQLLELELAKPSEALLAAELAIRTCKGDQQVIERSVLVKHVSDPSG